MPRKILDLDISEITLCGAAANRKVFFIKKSKEKDMPKFIDILKGFVVDEDDDELTTEEIAKAEALGKEPKAIIENAVNTFSEYKESMPEDLLAATKILVKQASLVDPPLGKEELAKAGAALSKSTKAQLLKALEFLKSSPQAVAILQTLLGQEVKKEDATGEGGEQLSAETQAKLDKLEALETAEKERIEKEQKEAVKKAEDKAKETEDRLEALEKEKGISKQVTDEDDDDETKKKKKEDLKKDEGDQWPSVYVPGLPQGEED